MQVEVLTRLKHNLTCGTTPQARDIARRSRDGVPVHAGSRHGGRLHASLDDGNAWRGLRHGFCSRLYGMPVTRGRLIGGGLWHSFVYTFIYIALHTRSCSFTHTNKFCAAGRVKHIIFNSLRHGEALLVLLIDPVCCVAILPSHCLFALHAQIFSKAASSQLQLGAFQRSPPGHTASILRAKPFFAPKRRQCGLHTLTATSYKVSTGTYTHKCCRF